MLSEHYLIFFTYSHALAYHNSSITATGLINLFSGESWHYSFFQVTAFPIILNPPSQYFEQVFKIPSGINANFSKSKSNKKNFSCVPFFYCLIEWTQFYFPRFRPYSYWPYPISRGFTITS